MSLKYGLNLKKPAAAPSRRPALLDDDDDDDDDDDQANINLPPSPPRSSRPKLKLSGAPPTLKNRLANEDTSRQNLSSLETAQARVKEAEALDPSIFDYDSFHDAKTVVNEAKKHAARQDAIERKPKYVNNLLDAAERRKQDQLVAREKLLQREREAEGDEFADKETFVTGAYKAQQEESQRVQEEEEKQAEADEKRKRLMGGGMQSFYRNMMAESERQHQDAVEAAAKIEREGGVKDVMEDRRKTNAQLAEELKAKGVNVQLNAEGEFTDKRQLLSAGLNVVSSGRSEAQRKADSARPSDRTGLSSFAARNPNSQQASRERQSRMVEEQLAAQAKRARDEEEEERARLERAAKSTKTQEAVSDAKARYLARKAAKEKGEGS